MQYPRLIWVLVVIVIVTAGGFGFWYMNSRAPISDTNPISSMEKPVYFLNLTVVGTNYDVRVNDVPIAYEDEGAPIAGQRYPINLFVQNGKNELTVHLSPVIGEQSVHSPASVDAAILVSDAADDLNKEQEIAAAHYASDTSNGAAGGDFEITNEGGITLLTLSFEVHVPFDAPVWIQGEVMKNPEDLKPQLIAKMKELWGLLDKKDIDGVAKWFAVSNQEEALRTYRSLEAVEQSFRDGLANIPARGGLTLQPFREKDLKVIPLAHGKLVWLVVGPLHASPVFFSDKNFDFVSHLEAYFASISGKGLVPVR